MNRILILAIALLLGAGPAHAGLGDALKKATKKVEDSANKATGKTDAASEKAGDASTTASGGNASAPTDKVSQVSTRFDYVPGDSVLFLDDFTQDELGEFPARWKLVQGTFEVAELDGERWVRGMSPDGRIRMKLNVAGALPELWTLDFDFLGTEPIESAITVRALGEGDNEAWEATYAHGRNLAFRSGEIFSTTPLEGGTVGGRHHFSFMARGNSIKAYMDRQRLASVPEIQGRGGAPREIEIRLWADTRPMIANVRFAQGPKPAKDLLAGGRLVTHGIHFESGSDVVLPDSAPILRQVAAWMEANPAAKLRVTGHTDNIGSAASNLDLSKRRAASVANVLSTQLGVAAGRFETDGKGDTQAMAGNAKAEGRAMNRRVEFARL
jgi:outer membrane protein OmpA-like peptidoglycan-associated protein